MANSLTRNPLIVDTQHASDVIVGGPRKLRAILWSGATTAAHIAEIQDKAAARTVWRRTATGSGFSCYDEIDFLIENARELIVPDLDSGILYLYIDQPG